MIVTSTFEERTWQIHFEVLLSLLGETPANVKPTSTLIQAVLTWKRNNSNDQSVPPDTSPEEHALLFLDVAKLELLSIVKDMDLLFTDGSKAPRKLDVRRLRVMTRQVYRNLKLVPAMISRLVETASSYPAVVTFRMIEHQCLNLVASSILIQTGHFLDGETEARHIPKHKAFHNTIDAAVDAICTSARTLMDELDLSTTLLGQAVLYPTSTP